MVVLTFESVDEILWCDDHSDETSLALLWHGVICFSTFFTKWNLSSFLAVADAGAKNLKDTEQYVNGRRRWHKSRGNSCLLTTSLRSEFSKTCIIAYTAKLSEVLESEEPFLDRFFPGAHVRAAEMSLQVILLFERVFNNQNQSCFLIIC